MPTCENLSYMLLNLVGEVGEFASKVAKAIRRGEMKFDENGRITWRGNWEGAREINDELKKEAGDMLWQLSGLCTVMGWTMEDVGQTNLDKLAARMEAGTIDGNGDGIIRGK